MDEILTLLNQISGASFAQFAWSHAPSDNYGVISIDGRTELHGNTLIEKMGEGTIDFYTRNPSSSVPSSVDAVLDSVGAAWYFNSLQYEQDTGLLHYEWVWQYG